jgi:nicotinamide-nucleotide amidase
VIDTNSLWLTERLNAIGVEVRLKTIVGDDEARLEEAISDALRRSEIVISTGRPRPDRRRRDAEGPAPEF